MGFVKYKKKELKKICETIRAKQASGASNTEIAETLNSEGVTTSSGLDWTSSRVSTFAGRYRRMITAKRNKGLREAARTVVATQGPISPDSIMAIVTDPHLNDSQRVRMITAYISL